MSKIFCHALNATRMCVFVFSLQFQRSQLRHQKVTKCYASPREAININIQYKVLNGKAAKALQGLPSQYRSRDALKGTLLALHN